MSEGQAQMGLLDGLLRVGLPLVPAPLLWSVARRYVAGSELPDALSAIARLRAQGYGTILDVLGENIDSAEQAHAAAAEYQRALVALAPLDPDCVISVKPTHLGLTLDPELCERLLGELCQAAAAAGRRVRFEMEDSATVAATLEVFRRSRRRHPNLGCVLQSRLFRTADDVEALLADGSGLNVRLVKGIYIEPPAVAWTADAEITASYLSLARRLLEGGAFVGLATHDGALARELLATITELGLDRAAPAARPYEFQCLMGVRGEFAAELLAAGHPVRIYVPYGRDWRAYSLRRLSRNPQIARHVLAALFRRGG